MKFKFKRLKKKKSDGLMKKPGRSKGSPETQRLKKRISNILTAVLMITVTAILLGALGIFDSEKTIVKYVDPILQSENITLNANGTYLIPKIYIDNISSYNNPYKGWRFHTYDRRNVKRVKKNKLKRS